MTTSEPIPPHSVMMQQPEVLRRNWGEERIVIWTLTHAAKLLKRQAGTKGGFQLHVKEESHYLMAGRVLLRTKDETGVHETIVEAGTAWTVSPGAVHQEEALTDCVVFEVSDPTREDRYAIESDPGGLPSMTNEAAQDILARLSLALATRRQQVEALIARIGCVGLDGLLPR